MLGYIKTIILIKYWTNIGNRKINLIPLEPLHVTAINIDTGSGNFRLKLDLKECDFTGFTTIENIKIEWV